MTETKKILLIGRSGRGKSTLANVITGIENKFKESGGSTSETRKIQFEEFEIEGSNTNYLVIDTPGIGDTKMSDNQVLDIIAEAVYLVRDGVSEVFFVIDGRFDQYEMITYNILRETIFDKDITCHTTITRTRFKDFRKEKKCQADVDLMIKEAEDKKNKLKEDIYVKEKEMENLSLNDEKYKELSEEIKKLEKELKVVNLSEIIESCQKRIVYVDNPPIEISGADEEELQANKKKRDKSREKLLNHLKNSCQKNPYKPEKLRELSSEIVDYMESKIKLEEELKRLKQEVKKTSNRFLKVEDSKNESKKISSEDNEVKLDDEKEKLTEDNNNQESATEDEDDVISFAIGKKKNNQSEVNRLEDKKEKLKKEIEEKEKIIRQKVLKHIFNNYNDIANVEGVDIFIDSVIDIGSWKEIHKEFDNKETVKKWLSNKFDYEKTQKWATALRDNFNPKCDAGFCAWLRDDRDLAVEKIQELDYPRNIEQLRKEYAKQLGKEVEILDKHNQQLIQEEEINKNSANILIIGQTGSGKSTLANVLSESNYFEESESSVRWVRGSRKKDFEWKGQNYRVIDVATGFRGSLSEKYLLKVIAEVIGLAPEGLSQVFFVVSERFVAKEIQTFKLFKKIIFKSGIIDYTTIVRTKFANFKNNDECNKDKKYLCEESRSVAKIIKSCRGDIVYVDNSPTNIIPSDDDDRERIEISKKRREKSRMILLDHLEKVIQWEHHYKLKSWDRIVPSVREEKELDEINSLIKLEFPEFNKLTAKIEQNNYKIN